ncbi:MAG: DUF819 family protein [Saprospiraceae bacterium]|nr:DUF819 family protein [Saprospiraceae bacterium]MBP7699593.1 DUF819 family protein [Saprospiraceae bacterium]
MLLYITNDAITLGILTTTVAFVLMASKSNYPFFKTLFKYCPPLLLCYFLPALMFSPLGWISAETSHLYQVATQIFLPAALVLFCLSLDLQTIIGLGPKAVWVFLAGAVGVILGGPIALFIVKTLAPALLISNHDQLWRGLSTIAGSWIGGSANQVAMKEMYQVGDDLFASMIIIDVVAANVWMGVLLYWASISGRIDKWLHADTTALDALKHKVTAYHLSIEKNASVPDIFLLLATAFGGVALSHWAAEYIVGALKPFQATLCYYKIDSITSTFFWIVLIATTVGVLFSFTPLRKLEGIGASKWGTVFIYFLVTTIGMKMNIVEMFNNLGLFVVGFIWMSFHAIIIFAAGRLLKAPFFFVAVGSQANIGGAASTPIIAAAFHPSLAPVGVLLAVLGYALGTYGGIICAMLLRYVALS